MSETPKRPIRIPDEIWAAVIIKANAQGTTASAVTRGLLIDWLKEDKK